MLLFKCDQFVGFTRLPSGHDQAVGGRMLDVFFQQQTVASYTFADAKKTIGYILSMYSGRRFGSPMKTKNGTPR